MYRQLEKTLLNSNICTTSPHNVVNFGPVTAEIGWRVWGTPANFNGFRVLASLLHRRRSTDINQTLHDVWPFPGLLHYVYIWGPVHQVAALLYGTRTVGIRQTLRRGIFMQQGGHPVRHWAVEPSSCVQFYIVSSTYVCVHTQCNGTGCLSGLRCHATGM